MEGNRFDELTAAIGRSESSRRSLLRRAGIGGFAALLTALGLIEAGAPEVDARRRGRRGRRGRGGGGGGGGGSSSSSSSSGGGGGAGGTGTPGGGANTIVVTVNNNTFVDANGDGLPDPPDGECAAFGEDCFQVPCCDPTFFCTQDFTLGPGGLQSIFICLPERQVD